MGSDHQNATKTEKARDVVLLVVDLQSEVGEALLEAPQTALRISQIHDGLGTKLRM